MLFIMKQKTFRKKAKKILPEKEYFIIDGEDIGSELSSKKDKTIADQFSKCVANGSFTPSRKLMRALLESEDDDYNPIKVEDMIQDYLESTNVIAAIVSSVKAIFAMTENGVDEINIFVVLPNKVYKSLSKRYKKTYDKLFPTNFQFVYLEEDLEDDKKLLTKDLSEKQLDKIYDMIDKNVKKYDLDKSRKDKKDKKKKDKKKKDKGVVFKYRKIDRIL